MSRVSIIVTTFFVFAIAACSVEAGTGSSNSSKGSVIPDKLCALTFDDGPDVTLTTKVLDKLQKHNVVATFFVIGQRVNESTKTVLLRMTNMGCEIGNHSWAWDSMTSMTKEQVKESVSNTSAAVEKFTGTKPKFFRPPNLAVNNTMYEAIDLPFVSGILGYDWAGCENRTAANIANNVINQITDGTIILLHDVQPEPHPTPEALDILIPELKARGYEFVTLSELFRRKGVDPNVEYKMWAVVK